LFTWTEVLEELCRCDGQITDYGFAAGQVFFAPAPGNAHTYERIEWEIFSMLRGEGWITTEDRGAIKRYKISEAGTAHLNEARPQYKILTRSAAAL
jgi:hypothetical protein